MGDASQAAAKKMNGRLAVLNHHSSIAHTKAKERNTIEFNRMTVAQPPVTYIEEEQDATTCACRGTKVRESDTGAFGGVYGSLNRNYSAQDPESTLKTSSTCPSLQAMTGHLALGYACCLIASVAYAVNYLPVKKYETGDGIFFTFAMSLGILVVGLLMGFMQNEPLHFEPLAAVGGVIFTLGNLLCPLVIQLIGLGLGLTMWDLSNMLMGWLTGHFGLFGVDPEISHKPLFNYSGLALACLSLVFMYLAARFDTTPKEADVEAPDEKPKELPEVSSPNPLRLVLGSSLAVLAGALFGTMFLWRSLPRDVGTE